MCYLVIHVNIVFLLYIFITFKMFVILVNFFICCTYIMTFFLFSPYSPEGYMARITFRLILLNAFNNPMYCKAVCNRDAFNVFVYPNGNIIFMYICFTMLAPLFNVYYSYCQYDSRVYVCHVQLKNCMGSKFRKYWLTLLNICYCVATTASYHLMIHIISAPLSINVLHRITYIL